jgi:hypothetical protein
MIKDALFSTCGEYRYWLSRQWDETLPWVMFIGLNPSKADAVEDDNTIKRVISIAQNLGYGGVVMCNCFPYVSTKPNDIPGTFLDKNDYHIGQWAEVCKDVVFCWGNFAIVRKHYRDKQLIARFPKALALHINKNGAPKHPLYCKGNIQPVRFKQPTPAITTYSTTPKNENA